MWQQLMFYPEEIFHLTYVYFSRQKSIDETVIPNKDPGI